MKRITQPLVDPQFYAAIANVMWKTCIAEGLTPKEFAEKKMVPRPDSLESFLLLFPFGINAKAVGDRTAVVQFMFSGETEERCYFAIEKGTVKAQKRNVGSTRPRHRDPFRGLDGHHDGQMQRPADAHGAEIQGVRRPRSHDAIVCKGLRRKRQSRPLFESEVAREHKAYLSSTSLTLPSSFATDNSYSHPFFLSHSVSSESISFQLPATMSFR